MHKILVQLKWEHQNLLKVLEILSNYLDHLLEGDDSDIDLIIELLEYLETFADLGHHPLENVIFDVAKKRMPDQSGIYERLGRQHEELERLTKTFRLALEGVMHETVMSREELVTRGRECLALQREHLDLEEQQAFPLLEEGLSEGDWLHISANLPKYDDPVFGKSEKRRFRNLVAYLSRH